MRSFTAGMEHHALIGIGKRKTSAVEDPLCVIVFIDSVSVLLFLEIEVGIRIEPGKLYGSLQILCSRNHFYRKIEGSGFFRSAGRAAGEFSNA